MFCMVRYNALNRASLTTSGMEEVVIFLISGGFFANLDMFF